MRLGEVLYEPGDTLTHVYFPITAIVSLLAEHRFGSIHFKLIDQGRYPGAIVMARAPI